MKTIFPVLVALCLVGKGFGQADKHNGPEYIPGKIYIDSRLPDIPLGTFIRYKDSTAKLSGFYNKIIILDFWFTHCTDCIKQFPKEDSLQKEFADDIQIIPVGFESKETISRFLNKWEAVHHTKLSLPFIVNDTLLNKFFGNPYFPHYVWIAQDRRIIAQTSEYFLTKENIEGLLRATNFIKKSVQRDSAQLNNNENDQKDLYNYYQIKPTAND